MIVFPNAKINIGLFVTEKRNDGFHNLETVFYPVGLTDILEVNEAEGKEKGDCFFKNSGIVIDCPSDKNLVIKAYRLLAGAYDLPAVNVHLHKVIPFGAGLGGGSSDAAFMLKVLNQLFVLNIPEDELMTYAAQLGSDCAFFIKNSPAFASGKGEVLENSVLSLKDYCMVLVKPACGVSTAEAYAGIVPCKASFDLRKIGDIPVTEWKNKVFNDFERTVFAIYPEIEGIKKKLYSDGAVFASMTGSGSAVFGLFHRENMPEFHFSDCFVWKGDNNY